MNVSKSNGSAYSGGNYFDSVTGSNEYERQSWRDSFNDGRAAGDLTGNTNARIESERENFQGATWAGSSTQPSALELARSFVGPGYGAGATGAAGHVGGSGQVQVVMGGPASAGGSGSGQRIVVSGAPLTAATKDTASGGWAGLHVQPNPWFSDVENWWEPRYGEPGEWLGGIVNIGADSTFNATQAVGLNTDKLFADLANAPGRVWANAGYDSNKVRRNADGTDWAPFWDVNASARLGGDGSVWKTGGGF